MDEKIRLQVQVPKYHEKWGKVWAWCKGRPLSTLINDVFQASVETNLNEIQRMVGDRADQMGISSKELIDRILSDREGED